MAEYYRLKRRLNSRIKYEIGEIVEVSNWNNKRVLIKEGYLEYIGSTLPAGKTAVNEVIPQDDGAETDPATVKPPKNKTEASGEEGGAPDETGAGGTGENPETGTPDNAPPEKNSGEEGGAPDEILLPDDFPHAADLRAQGYATLESLNGLKKTDLIELHGIGEVGAKNIIAARSKLSKEIA